MKAQFDSGDSMSDQKDNPGFVRVADCRDAHNKINLALWGLDGRAGMVKDIADIKHFMEQSGSEHKDEKQEKKEGSKALKAFFYSVIGGAIVAAVNYLFKL